MLASALQLPLWCSVETKPHPHLSCHSPDHGFNQCTQLPSGVAPAAAAAAHILHSSPCLHWFLLLLPLLQCSRQQVAWGSGGSCVDACWAPQAQVGGKLQLGVSCPTKWDSSSESPSTHLATPQMAALVPAWLSLLPCAMCCPEQCKRRRNRWRLREPSSTWASAAAVLCVLPGARVVLSAGHGAGLSRSVAQADLGRSGRGLALCGALQG